MASSAFRRRAYRALVGGPSGVQLLFPQDVGERLEPGRQVPPVGAGRQAEDLGGDFLRRRRSQVGPTQRPEALRVPGGGLQGRHRLLQDFSQRTQTSLRSGVGARRSCRQPAFHQPAPQQRVVDEPVRPLQLAEQGPNRLRELLAAEREQGGLPRPLGQYGDGFTRGLALAHQREPASRRHGSPVMAEYAVALPAEREVCLGHRVLVGVGHGPQPGVWIGGRQERDGEPGGGQVVTGQLNGSMPSSRPARQTSRRSSIAGCPRTPRTARLSASFNPRKFKSRYATFGFNDTANLDEGTMWPTAFALMELTDADEAKIGALVKKAVS